VVTWINDDGTEGETLTFGGLAAEASALALGLRERGKLAVGDPVLLLMQPSLDFTRALCACLLAGLVPVPLYPTNPFNLAADLSYLRRVISSCGARAALVDAEFAAFRRAGGDGSVPPDAWPEIPLLELVALSCGGVLPRVHEPRGSDVALLQFTSGSTSEPRGVRITHDNLAHQLACNRVELGMGPTTRAVMWVPPFHDLGLISGLINALSGNGRLFQLSPLAFVRRPALWLEVVSRVEATHTAAPNFAFGLVLRKTDAAQRARLRLGSLRVLMSAAEPISPSVMEEFFTAFAPAGLRREAFCAAYGLAEHTVGVSVGGQRALRLDAEALERGRALPVEDGGKLLQACGRPSSDVLVRIVDPATRRPAGEGCVGEIWVDSPSKADGYHGLAGLSEELFQARTAEPDEGRTFLRTGDLGFLHEGELFVTGRIKDQMIFRGRNLSPSDVEMTVAGAHPAVRTGCVVAFSIPTAQGQEGLCVVADVRGGLAEVEAEEVCQRVASAVQRTHGEPCHTVVLVVAGTVPKTTSGKLRRRSCRDALLRGELTQGPSFVRALSMPTAGGLPGLETLDDSLRRLYARFVNVFSRGPAKGDEIPGVTACGTMRVLFDTKIPPHRFLSPGAQFPVLVRHTNSVRGLDDAVGCGRAAAVRVLDPLAPEDRRRSLLDLPLQTGRTGLVRDAATYVRWFVGDPVVRAEMAAEYPSIRRYFEDYLRDPSSFVAVHYHSQSTSRFTASDGGRHLARFRLAEAEEGRDEGHVDLEGADFLAGELPRRPGDDRSSTHLRDDFRRRVETQGVCYRLALQLIPEPAEQQARDEAMDATIAWDVPWHDVAEISLDRMLPKADVDPLGMNPAHAPPDLAPVLARSAKDPASVTHLRSVVYELAQRLRRGEPLPESHRALLWKTDEARATRGGRRIAVLGAGPSGLTAARELEKLGHEVTVFERAPEAGGMASSIEIDGLPYDIGAHLCTGSYETVAALAAEVGIETVPTTGYFILDLESATVLPQDHSIFQAEAFERYQRARSERFPGIGLPGLASAAPSLASPVSAWLAAERLDALGASMGTNYTAAGYGYLDDPDLAAVYLVKFSEMIGALSPRRRIAPTWTFTIEGGFQRLWSRVAGELRDVRCGVTIDAIERRSDGVELRSGGERWFFDELVLAVHPEEALRLLDASPEERAVLGAMRSFEYVTTVCSVEGLPRQGLYLIAQNCATRRRAGRPVAYHHRHPGSDVFLFYSYGDDKADALLDEALREDIERLGGRLGRVHQRRRFHYMPHPTAEAIRGGFFERYEALQGHRRTYHVGGALGFELVECVAAHAREITSRFFGEEGHRSRAPGPALAAQAPLASETETSVEAWLSREVAAELDLPDPIPPHESLARYRIDSVVAASLLGSLSHRLGWSVPPHAVFDRPTIAAIARAALAARPLVRAPAPTRHLLTLRPSTPPSPIFCVGGMMGAALYLRELAEASPAGRPFFAFQAPGLDGRAPPCDSVAALAALYADELSAAHPDGPCSLLGHSFGGLVAYEAASLLVARGRHVERVILLDTMLFDEGEPRAIPDADASLVELLVAIHLKEDPASLPDLGRFLALSRPELEVELGKHLTLPASFVGQLSLHRWIEVYQAHAAAMRAFRPSPPVGVPVILLKAADGYPAAIMHPSRERTRCYDLPLLGWERLPGLHLQSVVTPGNHYTMVFGANARAAASKIPA
jgi:acyl-CoA synthetase (AMP-forming)/AMP-acid ligase II/thioesterase domain-containing protein